LCFIDGDWPLLSAPFTVDRVAVHYRKSLRRALQRSGPVHGQLRTDVAGLLNAKSPPAVQ
jgi:hypothetical protein